MIEIIFPEKNKRLLNKKLKILLDIVRKSTIIVSFCLELLLFLQNGKFEESSKIWNKFIIISQ